MCSTVSLFGHSSSNKMNQWKQNHLTRRKEYSLGCDVIAEWKKIDFPNEFLLNVIKRLNQ